MHAVNINTQTNGIGFWTAYRRTVKVTSLELIYDELRVYFDEEDWDIYEHGYIYTDEGWLESFKTQLIKAGYSSSLVNSIGYSEYSMQGDNYVSLDVSENFTLL